MIKRVAVASLAALMTIPNITVNTTYALDSVEVYERTLKNYEEQLKKYESRGNTVMVEKTKERIAQTKQQIEGVKQNKVRQDQREAKRQAEQAEKDRIANTIYPLTAKYVKDFVPAVDDSQPHFYERPDLPGVIFTLRKDSFGRITDEKPNFKIEKLENYHQESRPVGHPDWIFDDTMEAIKVSYTSPFNCVLGHYGIGDFTHFSSNNGFAGAWCHHIGENREVILARCIDMHYKSGWPDYYIGKQVNEINDTNCDPAYGHYPESVFGLITLEYGIQHAMIVFDTREKVGNQGTTDTVNETLGVTWMYEQDIYSVAREYGTD